MDAGLGMSGQLKARKLTKKENRLLFKLKRALRRAKTNG